MRGLGALLNVNINFVDFKQDGTGCRSVWKLIITGLSTQDQQS